MIAMSRLTYGVASYVLGKSLLKCIGHLRVVLTRQLIRLLVLRLYLCARARVCCSSPGGNTFSDTRDSRRCLAFASS